MRAVQLLRYCQISVLPVLLAAHVVGQWLIFPRDRSTYSYRADAGIWGEGLWIAQIILLTGWGILGPWRWYVRWPLTLAAIAYLLWPVRGMNLSEGFPVWICGPIVGVFGAALAFGRLRGRRLMAFEGPEPPSVPLRFSIRMICILTALAAVLTRGAMMHRQWLTAPDVSGSPILTERLLSFWFVAGSTTVALSAIGLLAYWALLFPGRTWWRLLLMAAAVGTLGVVIPFSGAKTDDIPVMLAWYGATATFITGTLLVLRAAGYRWMKDCAPACGRVALQSESSLNFAKASSADATQLDGAST